MTYMFITSALRGSTPPAFTGFPEGYESWFTSYREKDINNNTKFSIDFYFANDRISKMPELRSRTSGYIVKSLRNKKIDYTNNISFVFDVYLSEDDKYTKEMLETSNLRSDKGIYKLYNYCFYKRKYYKRKHYGLMHGVIPKEMFIEISNSKKLSLEFKFRDKDYKYDIKVPIVGEESFKLYKVKNK